MPIHHAAASAAEHARYGAVFAVLMSLLALVPFVALTRGERCRGAWRLARAHRLRKALTRGALAVLDDPAAAHALIERWRADPGTAAPAVDSAQP